MLCSIIFLKDYRVFKQGETYTFRSGVNLLVGDQGTGKSSMLGALQQKGIVKVQVEGSNRFLAFDFEKDNPRTGPFPQDGKSFMGAVMSHYHSHGETVLQLLQDCPQDKTIILMDEPDMGLSVRSIFKLIEILKDWAAQGKQVICTAHNPILIQAFNEVLSVEHKRWMSNTEFLSSQGL